MFSGYFGTAGRNFGDRTRRAGWGLRAFQFHQTGAQATAASTSSPLANELSLSHALMDPANPWARNWAMKRGWPEEGPGAYTG